MASRILACTALMLASLLSVAVWAQPVVVVLDYGEAPREQLRYRFTAGTTEQATMTMETQMSMQGASAPAMPMPAVSAPVTIHVSEVHPDGSARYEYEFSLGDLLGAQAMAALRALGGSVGDLSEFSGWAWIDARGNTLDAGVNLPEGLPGPLYEVMNGFQGQVQQMSAPFPAEAVGAGARWQVTSTLQMSGVVSSQEAIYTLVGRDGDTVKLSIETTQTTSGITSAAAGAAFGAGDVAGSIEGKGTGEMIVDPTRVLAKMEMESSTTTSTTIPMGEQSRTMAMSAQVKMSITPQ